MEGGIADAVRLYTAVGEIYYVGDGEVGWPNFEDDVAARIGVQRQNCRTETSPPRSGWHPGAVAGRRHRPAHRVSRSPPTLQTYHLRIASTTTMRLSFALLLPAMAGVAHAATPSIQGMIYWPSISVPKDGEELVLTPKQLRLVLAGQLDLSQYHALTEGSSGKTDPTTLDIINRLVDGQERLLDDESAERGRNLIIFRGNSEQIEKLKNSPNGKHNLELSYSYSVPESSVRLEDLDRLIADLKIQAAAADSTIHEFDLSVRAPDLLS